MSRIKSLPRRTVLRGLLGGSAVALALPMLEVMLDPNGDRMADGQELPVRFVSWFWGNGKKNARWNPDVTGVDYLTYTSPRHLPDEVQAERFEVVVSLLSHEHRSRLRLRVQVPESDPSVPTLFDVHPGTEAMEREVYDMFGIRFDGHPDLTRILMPEDWDGHPLRKDYAVGRIPVQFKGSVTER